MKKVVIFLRDQTINGLLLLLPVFVVLIVMLKVWYLLHQAVAQISTYLKWGPVNGVAARVLITTFSFALLCFVAGLFARRASVKSFREWIERRILKFLPGYSYLNTMLRERLGVGGKESGCVFARIEGVWYPGILVERKEQLSIVFIPGVPNPNAGRVCIVESDQLTKLDMSLSQLHESLEHYGQGLGASIGGKMSGLEA